MGVWGGGEVADTDPGRSWQLPLGHGPAWMGMGALAPAGEESAGG